jgi:ubiquitin conjugation factor E4 B
LEATLPKVAANSSAPKDAPVPVAKNITIQRLPGSSTKAKKSRPEAETLEQWTDRTLSSIFKVTVRENQKTDAYNNRLLYLTDLRQEKDEAGTAPLLELSNLDQAIIEAASQTPDRKPLGYLLPCWKRVMRLWRTARGGDTNDPKYQILKEAKRLCLGYCIFAATMPDMFGVDPTDRSPLVEYLLLEPGSEKGICPDFLSESVARFPEDDSIKDEIVRALEQLSGDLKKMTMNDAFKPYVLALRNCVRYPPICAALTESPKFLIPNLGPEQFEKETLLGPFFALSPTHADVAINFFMGATLQGESYIQANQGVIRGMMRNHQDELFEITNSIIKASKRPRERLLDWFAVILNKNHKRRSTWVPIKEVATDGFMINFTAILDRLCEPFMDATFSKLDRIDANYLRRSPRVDIADETKINADQKTSDEFYASKDDKENNFISEAFFLTVAAHHYGMESANKRVTQLTREAKQFEKEIAKFEAQRTEFASVSHIVNIKMIC